MSQRGKIIFATFCGTVLFLVITLWLYFREARGYVCPFYELTHWYCGGCGATRAAQALLRLDFVQALHANAYVTLLIGLVVGYGIYLLVRIVFLKKKPIFGRVHWTIIIILILLWMIFAIIRNFIPILCPI